MGEDKVSGGSKHGGIVRALLSILVVLSFMFSIPPCTQDAEAVTTMYIKYHQDDPDTKLNIYRASGFQYLKVEFTNNQEYIVTGAHFMYETKASSLWKGSIQITDWATSNTVEYDVALPATHGEQVSHHETFNGPEFLIVNGMFSMSVFPNSTETETLKVGAKSLDVTETSHTYNWYTGEDGWKPLLNYEFMLGAMVEPISGLDVGEEGRGGSMDMIDNVDLYKILLVGGKTYSITLDNPSRKNYNVALCLVEPIIRIPIKTMTGINLKDTIVFTPPTDSFYYILVEYRNNKASLTYGIDVRSNKAPVARIDGDTLVNVNQTARFSAENSTDDDGNSLSYSWDFDASDGISKDASKQSPSRVYRTAGSYVVTLEVFDGMEYNTTTWTIRVNARPLGSFHIVGQDINETTRLNFDKDYTFKAVFSDPENDKMTYEWDFGDLTTGTGAEVEHTYVELKNYTFMVKLTVSDISDKVDQEMEIVFNQLPEVRIEESATVIRAGKKVTLEGYGRDLDGMMTEYSWDLDGDGVVDEITEEQYIEVKFKKPGLYNVTFFVTDDNGGVGKASMTLEVKKRVEEKEDLSGLIGGVVALVVILVVVLVLYMNRHRFLPKDEDDETAVAAATPPVPSGPAAEEGIYPGQTAQGQPEPGPRPPPHHARARGEQYRPRSQGPGAPGLVPPPKPGKPSGPSLVAPPKPGEKSAGAGPRMVPPPKPGP